MSRSSVPWILWIHSLGVSTCFTSRQNRLTPIRIFCHILLPCSCFSFAQNITLYSVHGIDYVPRLSSKSVQHSLRSERNYRTDRNRDGRLDVWTATDKAKRRLRMHKTCNYRATRMHSANNAVARCLSVRLSVTLVFYLNSYMSSKFFYHRLAHHSSFSTRNGMAIFRRGPPNEGVCNGDGNVGVCKVEPYSYYRRRIGHWIISWPWNLG